MVGIRIVAWVFMSVVSAAGSEPFGIVTKVLHEGDAAPGVSGAVVNWVGPSQIDGAGNILVWGDYFDGSSGAEAYWYGRPGDLQLAAYSGMPAFDLPGVIITDIRTIWLGETGVICISARLSGAGVTGLNNQAVFVGHFGDIRLWVRAGDPAPGMADGVLFSTGPFTGIGGRATDGEGLVLFSDLAGPGVDETNDRAVWLWDSGEFALVWRQGMEAPGTGGARFAWADFWNTNGFGEMAFRGLLVHENGVDFSNQSGIWYFHDGTMELVTRGGDAVWGFSEDVFFLGGGVPQFSNRGDIGMSLAFDGVGVESGTGLAAWVLTDSDIYELIRLGGDAPGMGDGTSIATFSTTRLSERGGVRFSARLEGDVTQENDGLLYRGCYDDLRVLAREGDPVAGFSGEFVFSNLLGTSVLGSSNDFGDDAWIAEIMRRDGTDRRLTVCIRSRRTDIVYPMIYSEMEIDGRIVEYGAIEKLIGLAWWKSGGSDGQWQSFNDNAQLSVRFLFSDGSHGLYLAELPPFNDFDTNGLIDIADFLAFQECTTEKIEVLLRISYWRIFLAMPV